MALNRPDKKETVEKPAAIVEAEAPAPAPAPTKPAPAAKARPAMTGYMTKTLKLVNPNTNACFNPTVPVAAQEDAWIKRQMEAGTLVKVG